MPDTTDVDLFRALNVSDFPEDVQLVVDNVPATGILYPQFETKQFMSRGKLRTRRPDVQVTSENGENFVQSGGGTSLFDRPNVFGTNGWRSFMIPKGTVIPESLKIEKGGYNEKFHATHYQIEVKTGQMEIQAFKGALDNLARNAVVRAYENARV